MIHSFNRCLIAFLKLSGASIIQSLWEDSTFYLTITLRTRDFYELIIVVDKGDAQTNYIIEI